MCEDCHTSYWQDYGGGFRKPDSFIERSKTLIDMINAFHTRGALEPNYLTMNMGGIHFYDSIVVVEKSQVMFPPFDFAVGTPSF